MSIREALLKNESGRIEGIFKKAVRHILTGEFDRATLKRGWEYFKLWKESKKMVNSDFVQWDVVNDYAQEEGVNVYYYAQEGENPDSTHQIAVVEFPENLTLQPIVVEENTIEKIRENLKYRPDDTAILTDTLLSFLPNAVCGMIGPTRNYTDMLPNNGFYSRNRGVLMPFMDTNPVGQRRGAIAFKTDGTISILTEKQKLDARDNNFKDFNLVSGTSFYISSDDTESAIELLGNSGMSTENYLVLYMLAGAQRVAMLSVFRLINRKQVKMILDKHARSQGWESYIAAETELNGGGCYFKDDVTVLGYTKIDDKPEYPRGWLQWARADHYFMCKK